jgi:hypothetical protein
MTMLSARHCEPLAAKQSGFIEEINKKTEHHEKKLYSFQ